MCDECGTECVKHPGKFEGCSCPVIAELLYELVGISGQVDDLGDVQDFGWYALVDTEGIWYIVTEDNYGFFQYERYESEASARADWQSIEYDYDKYMSQVEV